MLPTALRGAIEDACSSHVGEPVTIERTTIATGGCINRCVIVDTNVGSWFLKWNDTDAYPGMMQMEKQGLSLMRDTQTVHIPQTILAGEADSYSFLLMEYIPSGSPTSETMVVLGQQLARLHRHTQEQYGLDHDNYVGSLPQRNTLEYDWATFFAAHRITPMLAGARDAGYMSRAMVQQTERMLARWNELVPVSLPALLHGDLWSGNFRVGHGGKAWLIDPAVYYGHREMDIAMTQLFGGFSPTFYEGYMAEWPLEPGWQQRIGYHNLYPLLVHVNLFGHSYVGSVAEVVKGF